MELASENPAFEILDGDWRLWEIALLAEQWHSNEDEYHHFGHPLEVLTNAKQWADRYNEHNPDAPVNHSRIYKAILLHDIAVHEELDTDIFPTKEHRSAYLADVILKELDEPEDEIKLIQAYILTTNADYGFGDLSGVHLDEAKIICKADIGNVFESFPHFFKKFGDVYCEIQKARIKKLGRRALMNPREAAEGSIELLSKYIQRDLSLGDWDTSFEFRASHNFEELRNIGEKQINKLVQRVRSSL